MVGRCRVMECHDDTEVGCDLQVVLSLSRVPSFAAFLEGNMYVRRVPCDVFRDTFASMLMINQS